MAKRIGYLGVIAVLLVGAAACSSDSSTSPSRSTASTAGTAATGTKVGLVGTTWVLRDSSTLGVPLGGAEITARFDNSGTVSGDSGCNTYRGPYSTDGAELTIGPNLATTMKTCPAQNVETAYLAALVKTSSFQIQGKTLTLRSTDDKTLLEYDALVGSSALVGNWKATSYYTGSAVQSVVGDVELTAAFTADSVSGNSGCNTYSGPVKVDGEQIEIGPLRSTLMACTDDALSKQEHAFTAALELATSYQATKSHLQLLRADGAIAATFDAAEPNG